MSADRVLLDARRSPRSRGPVGARRSRRLLTCGILRGRCRRRTWRSCEPPSRRGTRGTGSRRQTARPRRRVCVRLGWTGPEQGVTWQEAVMRTGRSAARPVTSRAVEAIGLDRRRARSSLRDRHRRAARRVASSRQRHRQSCLDDPRRQDDVHRVLLRITPKPSKPWACRSKTLTPTPEPAGYCAGDVAGERGNDHSALRRVSRPAGTRDSIRRSSSSSIQPSRSGRVASVLGTEGTFHGYDGLDAQRAGGVRGVPGPPLGADRLIDGGDHVVAIVENRGYGKHSGVEVNVRTAHVWTLRGGRIVAWHIYLDPTQALEAVGLSEQDAHADS